MQRNNLTFRIELISIIPIQQIFKQEFQENLHTSQFTEKILLDANRTQIQDVDYKNVYIIVQVACNYLNQEYKQGMCRLAALALYMTNNSISQAINILIYLLQQYQQMWNNNQFCYQWCKKLSEKYNCKEKDMLAEIKIYPNLISLWSQNEQWNVKQRIIYIQSLMIFGSDIHYQYTEYAYQQQMKSKEYVNVPFQQFLKTIQ